MKRFLLGLFLLASLALPASAQTITGLPAGNGSLYVAGQQAYLSTSVWNQTILGSVSTFTGAISGTTLTTSGATGTAIAIGQTVQDAAGLVTPGTTITAGSGTSWTVTPSQTVASETMFSNTYTSLAWPASNGF